MYRIVAPCGTRTDLVSTTKFAIHCAAVTTAHFLTNADLFTPDKMSSGWALLCQQTFAYKLKHINSVAESLNEPESEEDDIAINNAETPVVVSFNARDLLTLTADSPLPECVPEEVLLDLKEIVYMTFQQN